MINTSQIPPIWVINLKRSTARREYIVDHLNKLGLPFELIEAVDGKELPETELAEIYNPQKAFQHINRELVRGEIGCSLSHLKLYQRMVAENLAQVIILEDDAVLNPDILEIINSISRCPKDWELILFHYYGDTSFWHKQHLYQKYCLAKFATIVWSCLAYIITLSAAKKLLAMAYPISVPIDYLTGGSANTNIRLYGIAPVCANPVVNIPTTIPGRIDHICLKEKLGIIRWLLYQCKLKIFSILRRLNPRSIIGSY